MDYVKKELLGELLRCNLEVHALRHNSSAGERALWVAEHLVIYVSRVAGFLAVPECTLYGIRDHSVIAMVDLGFAVLASELERTVPGGATVTARKKFESEFAELVRVSSIRSFRAVFRARSYSDEWRAVSLLATAEELRDHIAADARSG